MIIELRKFGEILTSRKAGGEALAAFLPTLRSLKENGKIKIDFKGVSVLTPSWADEFVRPILEKYGQRVSFVNDSNPSVKAAMKFANPELDLSKVTVFEDTLVFDEKSDDKIYSGNKTWLILTFPYDDESALQILKNHKISSISVFPVDAIANDSGRLKSVIEMLNKSGIRTTVAR